MSQPAFAQQQGPAPDGPATGAFVHRLGLGGPWEYITWTGPGSPVPSHSVGFDGPGCLYVTDFEERGDQFALDTGGATSTVPYAPGNYVASPDTAFDDPSFSSGVFYFGAGFHSVHFAFLENPYEGGTFAVRLAECLAETKATFQVTKDFSDDNPADVDVTVSCNTGLPIEVTKSMSEDDGVIEFIVKDFTEGTLNCTVTEEEPDGYDAEYFDGNTTDGDSCEFTGVGTSNHVCQITNELEQVEIEVTKDWIDPKEDYNNAMVARADYYCYNARSSAYDTSANPGNQSGTSKRLVGDGDTVSIWIYPNYGEDYPTECDVDEEINRDSGIISDSSDCQDLLLVPGGGAECTLVNTRFYEGIPTLSQYGLAIMALLMLGLGAVGFRRFV